MAYSDYGAFVWKNGKEITKECADTTYYLMKNGKSKKWKKFVSKELEEELEAQLEDTFQAGGHAVLQLGNFCLVFYKACNPQLIYSSGKKENLEVLLMSKYLNKKLDLQIIGYTLGSNEAINMFEIRYKEDYYCVICGYQIGNGLEENETSKYISKHIRFNEDLKDYYIDHNVNDLDIVFDKLGRKDAIKFQKYCLRKFGFRPLFKDIKAWDFNGIKYDIKEILRYRREIKWLK